ncbi:hypothetical protein C0W65_02080 [Bacillus subtilis]|nr:hypothetical protein C0W65_02080 [Bacillus subtilis]
MEGGKRRMREIKFRVWDIVWKKMLTHEDLWDAPFNELFISTPDQRPYNIMQYTGLKDKNGREIYEGDSILYDRNIAPSIDSRKYVVKWEDSKFVLTNSSETIDDFTSDIIEVIGNIYEIPELLEGAE